MQTTSLILPIRSQRVWPIVNFKASLIMTEHCKLDLLAQKTHTFLQLLSDTSVGQTKWQPPKSN